MPAATYAERVEHDELEGLAPGLVAPAGAGLVVAPAVRPEMVADPEAAGEAEDFLRRVALALGADPASNFSANNLTNSGVPE